MEPKQGKNTTEFWLTLGLMAVAVLNGTEYVNIPWDQFVWLATATVGYTGARSFVKGRANF